MREYLQKQINDCSLAILQQESAIAQMKKNLKNARVNLYGMYGGLKELNEAVAALNEKEAENKGGE